MDTISRFFGNGKKNRTRKKASAALPGKVQRGGLALESLEARTTPSATVFTDLLDYQPGDTALITAKDFAAGSTVEFQVLHVNGNNGGQGHIPWRVTDGSQDDLDHTVNGVIQTCWYVNPDDSQGEAFVLTALGNGPDMTFGTADDEKASTTFTDAFPGVTLNQWETLDHKWANGQANTNQTRYLEGDTVPYAAKFTNLTAGNTYGFIINLNTYQQNTNAGGFIYLDSYNRSVNPNSTAFGSAIPGSDLSVLTDGNYASQTSQSSATFSSVDANVTTVDIGNGTGTGSLDRYAKVVFTASSSTAVIYWGQRLALPGQVERSAGNFAPYGAASFTGGSLQTKIDGSGNSGVTWITPSNAVQLMQGVVVQGSIQGLKWNDLNNNGIKDSGEPLMSGWTIQLFSDSNTDGVFDSGDTLVATQVTDTTGAYKFSPVVRGTYFVQEVGQSGWDQTYPATNNGVWGPLVVDENTPNYTEIDFGNFSPNAKISINKVTKDGNAIGDGITVLSGEQIQWVYTVTNPGNVPLSGVTVVDSISGVVPAYVSGDSNSDGKLQIGESWVFQAIGTSILGAYSNIGTATGAYKSPSGKVYSSTASDASNYVGVNPVISIDKVTVDGVKSGDGLTILSSEPIKWRYTVTNPGAVVLSGVVVVDSISGVVPAYVSGDSNSDGKLQNGESWVYEASGTSILGAYSNTGTASGSFSDDAGHLRTATASDSSNYVGVNPVIAIDKVTAYNGSEGDGLHIPAGAALEWKYYVTNPGAVPLANVQVKDDNGTPTNLTDDFFANYVSGDTGNGLLDPGETWVFDKSGVSNGGAYSNTGTATGDFSDDAGHLRTATAKDASSYFGEFQFTTVTLGGWGATPSGNNPGTYLNTHFTSAFDNNNNQTFDGGDGLVVPRPNITTVMKDKKTGVITTTTYSNDILLHTADDVRAFLRATNSTPFNGMTVDGLSVSGYRPTTLEKQYVALTLNVTFDAVDSNFGISGNKLGDLKLQGLTGSLAQLNDMTIQGVLDVVGAYLNGSNSYGLSPGDLTMLLGSINEAFDGGHESNWAMIHLH